MKDNHGDREIKQVFNVLETYISGIFYFSCVLSTHPGTKMKIKLITIYGYNIPSKSLSY